MMTILLPLSTLSHLSNWGVMASSLILCSLLVIPMNSSLYGNSYITMMDTMSNCLILLSIWITSLMILASMKIKHKEWNHCHFSLLVISLMLILVLAFSLSNTLAFYVMFEASLIPTMTLISLWGYQPERLQASLYLMLYTVTASFPLLLAIVWMTSTSCSHSMLFPWLNQAISSSSFMNLCLVTAFLVKLPMFSMHLWLPKAHVEAPVAGSMILAAVLLKLGGYGLLRFMTIYPMIHSISMAISSLALIGGMVASIVCIRQTDMKSLIAYSSVSHMGLLIAGSMTSSALGGGASLSMMVAHGMSSSALFCLANITYESSHSRSILLNKGLLWLAPQLSLMWFIMCAINMACPPSLNLLSEILLLMSASSMTLMFTVTMASISFITAAYSMILYTSSNHGHPLTQLKPSFMSNHHLNMSLLILHLWPATLLILKPELFSM